MDLEGKNISYIEDELEREDIVDTIFERLKNEEGSPLDPDKMYEDIKDIELTEKGEVDHRGDVNVDTLESITANVGSEDDARIADSIDDILCELGVREEERAT